MRDSKAGFPVALRAAIGFCWLASSTNVGAAGDSLADLSRTLFDAGVTPYYLHLPDRVRGTAHFDVPEPEAQRLVAELATRLSGYLVPKLVREVPGAASKVPSAHLT